MRAKRAVNHKTVHTTRLNIQRIKREYWDDLCEEYHKSIDRVLDALRDIEDDLKERDK